MTKVEVWGNLGCFTRHESGAERRTYDVMTPSAAAGILESIFWHPGVLYRIDRIYVLMKSIRKIIIMRNERKTLKPATNMGDFEENHSQGTVEALYQPHYLIEAHMTIDWDLIGDRDREAGANRALGKYYGMFEERLKKGACAHQPYFGYKEFTANFAPWPEDKSIQTLPLDINLGPMLHHIRYGKKPKENRPVMFQAELTNGVLECAEGYQNA